VTDHGDGGWDLIVTPWHLDEHIPAFPIPANVTETICPALPAGPGPDRMTVVHQAVAGAVARAARPRPRAVLRSARAAAGGRYQRRAR
jgi:arginase